MAVPPESIQVGRCYLSDKGKVWRVVRIWPDGRVQFEFQSRVQKNAKVWKLGMLEGSAFAASAQRQVPCDWMPEGEQEQEVR